MAKVFYWTFPVFLVVIALVVRGGCYQAISIVPFWLNDLSMFKNYGHWGINYFPILSLLMTVLWLIVLVTGFKARVPNKTLLYIAHFLFLLITVSTFTYFAPFLLTHMGHPQNNISDQQLAAMLNTWAKWDVVRQIVGLIFFAIFIYCYGKIEFTKRIRYYSIKHCDPKSVNPRLKTCKV
jgi:hypothetical protein